MTLTPPRAIPLVLAIAVLVAATAAAPGSARTARPSRNGVLSGTWTGVLRATASGTARHERIRLVVNVRETAGSWRVNASCHGRLTLDSISNGYHHYLRHLARGASCLGGDIDCLERAGKNVADWVTPRSGGWARNGTLHRVR